MTLHTQWITLTEPNFQAEVLEAQIPVLVDFWASWCTYFQQINPVLHGAALDFAGQVKFGRLNIAIADSLAKRYDIRAVPTLILFQKGRVMERVTGCISKQDLDSKLQSKYLVHSADRSPVSCL
ncbi:MAG: thioredoxin [Cyanobacteria bacterium J069]|nr:MAG: thioredoxin [Cyanobacteria bacterium J069]